jgi:hypothetical protein
VSLTSIDGRVQTLNMRAPDEATAQRVAALVEELIRMAAIDAEIPGGVLVVRQLDIGAIPNAAPLVNLPPSIAATVRAVVERVAANAVSGDHPAAATAPMVYFKDDSSVVLALAQRVAANRPTTEWFWPSLVKGWTPNTPVDRAITLLIERAMSTSGGVVTLARVVETLASTGVLDTLLQRLTPADGRALLRNIGWTEGMVIGQHAAIGERAVGGEGSLRDPLPLHLPMPEAVHVPAHVPVRSQNLAQRWVSEWGGDTRDPRALWLGAMLLVADGPARSKDVRLPDVVRAWLVSVLEQSRAAADQDVGGNAAAVGSHRDDLIADARAWLQSHPRSPLDSLFGGGPPAPFRTRDATSDLKPGERPSHDDEWPSADHPPDTAPTWKSPRPTNHAGFFFLVPLLTHTGVPNIIANNASLLERGWPIALLLRLARRLGIPRDDPAILWIATAARPTPIEDTDRALTAEVMRAARIRLRFEARITMRRLVHRAGAVVAAPSHVDVLLHHEDVDEPVRQAGLDAGGFVAWLGRAIEFHYSETVDVNA